MRLKRAFLLTGLAIGLAVLLVTTMAGEFSPPSRTFLFSYRFTLKDIPTEARRVRVWVPRAASDMNQAVTLTEAKGPAPLRETREARFGNYMLYAEIARPESRNLEFALQYQVTRKEYSKGNFATLANTGKGAGDFPRDLHMFLLPDRLVPIDGRIRALADENTQGQKGTVAKARALYDYVFHTVRYDKSGTGWGRGDSLWVCDAKHGNCTDFHSLFISLARAEGIPARFEIGFPLPASNKGVIPGYHCWAEFFTHGAGWVPVDISEAWQDPKKHDYFFGALDANRVQFSVGRDLVLQPRQDGAPVNYFIYPYVEIDGRPFQTIEKQFSFREVAAMAFRGDSEPPRERFH